MRLLPALPNAIATACLIAFFFVAGWLAPIDPLVFQPSTSVLILLLTSDWPDPFLIGMLVLLSTNSRVTRAYPLYVLAALTKPRARRVYQLRPPSM